ncbi:MAG: hypothetical protein LN546_00515 [Rickettsia endosymbiont of Ecitomorpha arachnoides]|nr:hypothetical protein [Rickettsia endosymbiont of Ecitomorpha arachnoides]
MVFPLEVTIKNNTNQAVFAPEISFDLSKVQHIDTNQPINAYTGFTHHSNTFPVIKGNLAEHLATLLANGSVTVTFGVSFNPAVLPNPNALPEKFTFNGELIGNPEPEPEPEPGTSKLVQKDDLTEQTYKLTGFNPKSETINFSYTSGRVLKDVYNKYESDKEFEVGGYYTAWSQFDIRLQDPTAINGAGRGVDIKKHYNHNFDKLVLGFPAINGDKGEKEAIIKLSVDQLGLQKFEMTTVGNWDMLAAYVNCGFPAYAGEDYPNLYTQQKAQGALGAFHNLKKASPEGTKFALSVGGWTMSEAFHEMAKSPAARKIFNDSIVKFIEKFPMYKQIDVDWEYPGAAGNGNPHGPEDGGNYTLLVKELRETLNAKGHTDVVIAIAAAADPAKLALSNIKDLVDAGVTQIHLMTYDLFGGTYGEGKLAHHTNLYSRDGDNKEWSINQSVKYLTEELKIPAKCVHIGYAGYSRSAREVEIESVSPLKGTYKVDPQIVGTFENGVTEQNDVYFNYFDPSTGKGKNGFILYTDTVANADFLYNPTSKVFMSIDTPRTIKAKAEYAKKHGLGGIFTWTVDQDNGALSNAAHEGLGHKCVKQNIDMSTFYFEGETELVGYSSDTIVL